MGIVTFKFKNFFSKVWLFIFVLISSKKYSNLTVVQKISQLKRYLNYLVVSFPKNHDLFGIWNHFFILYQKIMLKNISHFNRSFMKIIKLIAKKNKKQKNSCLLPAKTNFSNYFVFLGFRYAKIYAKLLSHRLLNIFFPSFSSSVFL